MMVKKDKLFQSIANLIMIILSIICLCPFLLLIGSSLSNQSTILNYGYSFIPKELDFTAYKYVFSSSSNIIKAYGVSIMVMLIGTAVNLIISLLFAYPLSRRDLPGRNLFSFILFFTLLFNGGLVPTYIMWTRTFHIKNTIFALIVPNLLMNGFYVILARNYFSNSIPESIIESAKIDGASELRILAKIVLPMSKPIIATLGLFVSLSYWNDWLNGLYYVSDEKLYTIQVLLNRMLMETMYLKSSLSGSMKLAIAQSIPTDAIKMAVAVVGVLPLLIIYPFVSKRLTSGIVIGAVKE